MSLNDLKPGSNPDRHKISAFQVAPARKTAFDKSREEAQQRADKEAAETAAVLAEFQAEYGIESDRRMQSHKVHGRPRAEGRNREEWKPETGRNYTKRDRDTYERTQQTHPRDAFDNDDSEEEEKEWRRSKMTAGANFLDELKHKRPDGRDRRETERRVPADIRRQDRQQDVPGAHASARTFVDDKSRAEGQEVTDARQPVVDEAEDESGDDVDYYRTKASTILADAPLNKIHRKRLDFLLDTLTSRRGSIARISAFAMTHASSVNDIADAICARIATDTSDWKVAVARLCCISDILHNSWIPIPNVWKYRNAFEIRLLEVIKVLKALGEDIASRIRRENYRRLISAVLHVWSTWICFSSGVTDSLIDAFADKKETSPVVKSQVKEKKKGGGWKKIDGSAQQDDGPAQEANVQPELDGPEVERESENHDELESENHDVDGEAIDLDGQEVDLDGEDINLDDVDEASIQDATRNDDRAAKTEHVQRASPTESINVPSDPGQMTQSWQDLGDPPMSIKNAPKVKMSFGKISFKPIGQQATSRNEHEASSDNVASSLMQPPPVVDAAPVNSTSSTELATRHLSAVPSEPDRPMTTQQVTSAGTVRARPQRRSAADFMD